ncbi:uncharacterized protein [Palaemon carinicauda]|uniref:uncharacterized protein n=1 Tax=Palaemon carinicauda TaxID=392227 RepID=UPI0035B66E4B
MRILLDTGACRSLLPRPLSRIRHCLSKPVDIHLVASNRPEMPIHCYETLTLSFRSAKYNWKFLVADITLSILSADFLSHFHLLVNDACLQLVNADSYSSTLLQSAPSNLALHINTPTNAFAYLLTSYPEVFRPEPLQMSMVPTTPYLSPYQDDGVPSVRQIQASGTRLFPAAKEMFAEMEERVLCQKASIPWSSPLHIVHKRDASLHTCGD